MLSSVLLIILAGLAFGVIHTVLASMRVKNWARRRWGEARVDRWYRLFFSAAAVVTFLPVLVLTALLPEGDKEKQMLHGLPVSLYRLPDVSRQERLL